MKSASISLPELSPAPLERQIPFEIRGDGCIVVCGAALRWLRMSFGYLGYESGLVVNCGDVKQVLAWWNICFKRKISSEPSMFCLMSSLTSVQIHCPSSTQVFMAFSLLFLYYSIAVHFYDAVWRQRIKFYAVLFLSKHEHYSSCPTDFQTCD